MCLRPVCDWKARRQEARSAATRRSTQVRPHPRTHRIRVRRAGMPATLTPLGMPATPLVRLQNVDFSADWDQEGEDDLLGGAGEELESEEHAACMRAVTDLMLGTLDKRWVLCRVLGVCTAVHGCAGAGAGGWQEDSRHCLPLPRSRPCLCPPTAPPVPPRIAHPHTTPASPILHLCSERNILRMRYGLLTLRGGNEGRHGAADGGSPLLDAGGMSTDSATMSLGVRAPLFQFVLSRYRVYQCQGEGSRGAQPYVCGQGWPPRMCTPATSYHWDASPKERPSFFNFKSLSCSQVPLPAPCDYRRRWPLPMACPRSASVRLRRRRCG